MVHCKTAKKTIKKTTMDTKIKTNRNKSKKKTVVHDNIGRVGHCRAVTVAQFPRQDSATGKPGKPGKLAPGKWGCHEVTPFVESATSCSHVVNHGKHCGYHCEDLVSRIGARGRLWQAASRIEDIVPALVVILAVRHYIVTITSPSRVRTHRRGGPAWVNSMSKLTKK